LRHLTHRQPVDWMSLGPYAILFMRTCFTELFSVDRELLAVRRVCANIDGGLVEFKEGLAHFLRQQRTHALKKAGGGNSAARSSGAFAASCKRAAKSLEASMNVFE
jgi:hypothetical protein